MQRGQEMVRGGGGHLLMQQGQEMVTGGAGRDAGGDICSCNGAGDVGWAEGGGGAFSD